MSDDRPAIMAVRDGPTIVVAQLAHEGTRDAYEARWKNLPSPDTLVGRGATLNEAVGDLVTENPDILGLGIDLRVDPVLEGR